MAATLRFDWTKFNATLRQYLVATSLTIAQAMNKKGYDLVLAAGSKTKQTYPETIEGELGPFASRVVGSKIRITKKGVKRGRDITEKVFPPLTYALAGKRLGKGATQIDIQRVAEKIYGLRKRSVGFIKQGWIPAKEILKRSDRGGEQSIEWTDKALKRVGRLGAILKEGGAESAKRSFNPMVRVWNYVTNSKRTSENAYAVGNAGLQAAFDKVTADMLVYLNRKMGKDTSTFNTAQRR